MGRRRKELVIAFHIYMILGFDSDTFELNAGDIYFKQAQEILNYSQQSGFSGWQSKDGRQNRFELIDNVLSSTFIPIRSSLYNYHIKGLDLMTSDSKLAKTKFTKNSNLADIVTNSGVARLEQIVTWQDVAKGRVIDTNVKLAHDENSSATVYIKNIEKSN